MESKVVDERDVYKDEIEQPRLETADELRENENDTRVADLMQKSMHGEWFRNLGEDTSQKTFDFMRKGYLDKRIAWESKLC